jgi:hypothetical protein
MTDQICKKKNENADKKMTSFLFLLIITMMIIKMKMRVKNFHQTFWIFF